MRCILLMTAIAILFPPNHLQAVDYDINMSRRAKVGDRYHIECIANDASRNVTTIDGQVTPAFQSNRSCKLIADAETVAVGEGGSEVHIRIAVNVFTYKVFDEDNKALPAGTIIEAKWENGKQVYLVNGKPADTTLAQMLPMVIFPEPPAYSIHERMAGTTTKQAVGGQWPVNAEAIAEIMSKPLPEEYKKEIKAENITGTTTLAEATDTELKLVTEYVINDGPGFFEPGVVKTMSKSHNSIVLFSPIDVQQRPRKVVARFIASSSGEGVVDGKPRKVEMTYRAVTECTMTPLPTK